MSVISDFKAERQRRASLEGPPYSVLSGPGLPAFDMAEVAAALWREKWRVAGVLAAALAACAAYLFAIATPRYAATAVVMLNTRQESVVDLESVMSGLSSDLATINTEIEVMRSRHLLGRVADDLALDRDPEFNAALRPVRFAGIRGAVARYAGIGQQRRAAAHGTRQRVIDALLDSLSITAVRQSYVFRITAMTADPGKSAQIANRIAELYIVDQLDVKAAANDKAADWLRGQVSNLTERLEESEAAVDSHLAATPLVSEEGLAALQGRIKDLRGRRRELAVSEASGPQAAALDASIEALEDRRQAQAADLLELRRLQREAEANLQIQKHFLSRLKEISVQQGIQRPDARVISSAETPPDPAEPKIVQSFTLAAVFGLFLGCVLVLGRERLSQSFATSGDLEAETLLPVLGSVPLAPVRRREKLLGYVGRHPSSGLAESVRNLRTSLLLRDAQNPPRVVLTTSSVPGEGKSTLA
ncbi:MAG: GumC family protein, partial [Paracoccaceae bacterium]